MNKLLEEIKPDLMESLKKEMLRDVSYDARRIALDEIKKVIVEFAKEEIIPEVKRDLIENKEALVSVGIKAGPMIAENIAKAMSRSVADKLDKSYTRDDLLKSLFK